MNAKNMVPVFLNPGWHQNQSGEYIVSIWSWESSYKEGQFLGGFLTARVAGNPNQYQLYFKIKPRPLPIPIESDCARVEFQFYRFILISLGMKSHNWLLRPTRSFKDKSVSLEGDD